MIDRGDQLERRFHVNDKVTHFMVDVVRILGYFITPRIFLFMYYRKWPDILSQSI